MVLASVPFESFVSDLLLWFVVAATVFAVVGVLYFVPWAVARAAPAVRGYFNSWRWTIQSGCVAILVGLAMIGYAIGGLVDRPSAPDDYVVAVKAEAARLEAQSDRLNAWRAGEAAAEAAMTVADRHEARRAAATPAAVLWSVLLVGVGVVVLGASRVADGDDRLSRTTGRC